MTGTPAPVDPAQLEVLRLGVDAGDQARKRQKRRPAMAVRQVAELAKLSLTPEEEERKMCIRDSACVGDHRPELLQVGHGLLGGADVRLGDDLDQGYACLLYTSRCV